MGLNTNFFGISNLAALSNAGYATTKTYVDNKAKKYRMLSGAFSNLTITPFTSTIIFSILGSHPGSRGYFCPVSGRVLRICYIFVTNVGGYTTMATIGLVKNGTSILESEHAVLQSAQRGMKTYATPISFAEGDTLAFSACNVA